MVSSHSERARARAGAAVPPDVPLRAGQVGTWHWDIANERVTWSANMESIHGMPPGSFDGSLDAFQRTVHADDRERVRAALRAALENDADYFVEYRNLTNDGNIIWLATRGQVLRDDSGAPVAMAGVCMDVTERKQSEFRLATQYAVTRLLTESEHLDTLAPQLLATICDAVGWQIGEIWRWDNDREVLRNAGRWFDPELGEEIYASAGNDVFRPGEGLPGRVWSSGKAAWIRDVRGDPGFLRQDLAEQFNLHAAFAFPIHSGRTAVGVMVFLSRDVQEPNSGLFAMFEALGGQIGNALERRRAELALRRRAEQQTAVARLGQAALARPGVERILDQAIAVVSETLDVEFVEVLEMQQDGNFRIRGGTGSPRFTASDTTVPGGRNSQAGFTIQSSSPVIVTDLDSETRFEPPELLLDHKVKSGLTTLIHGRTRPFGVLGGHTRRRRNFSEDDSNFLQAVANVLAMAIESGKAEETIRMLSTPILPLDEDLLILPVIGAIDARRMRQLGDQLLSAIRQHRARVVVIDVTGSAPMEPAIVESLMKKAEASRLLGASIIMTGISNQLGKALVDAGVERTGIISLADLRSGVAAARELLAETR